jgi:ABC-type multidrug transport system ATPase subunit
MGSIPISNFEGGFMMLRVRSLDKSIGRQPVLRAVDLSCGDGETICVLGENGAGKSTLLSIIAGIVSPDAGKVWIEDPNGIATMDRRLHLGYLPESPNPMPWLGVAEWLSLVASLRRSAPPTAELLDALDLNPLLYRRLESLSLGQRRRVHLAAALVGNPWLLVADEPTNGLDVQGISVLIELLETRQRNGLATLIATHDRAFAEAVGRRCLRLEGGHLAVTSKGPNPQ